MKIKTLDDFPCICRNLPGNDSWEGSFYEFLKEESIWDIDEFWLFHMDLIRVAESVQNNSLIDRELAHAIVYFNRGVNASFTATFDRGDGFSIRNLKKGKLREFKERFDLAVLGAFSGEILPETSFDLKNPLIDKLPLD